MKIVIDIPKEDYLNLIKTDENGEKEIPLGLLMSLWDSVKYKCTPLPKNHGRLIDEEEILRELGSYHIGGLNAIKNYHGENTWEDGLHTAWRVIDDAETIIDAESDEKGITDGDLISRQAVLDIFGDIHPLDYNARAYVAHIKELPSAEKTAEWILKDGIKTCNNCGIGLASAYDSYCSKCV